MLGADVGTALVTVLLSFDLSWLAPLLIFSGIVLFLSSQASAAGRFGQILIGLGLIMFALQWISVAAHPIVQAAGVKVIFASLTGDVLLDMLVAALFTVLCYSSLAVVLLVATLASLHVIALPVALGRVLGANHGSGILGMLSTLRATPEARRVTLGNFIFKLIGSLLAYPLVGHLESWIAGMELDPSREVVLFHLFFNVALALLLVFWTERIARIAERMLPARPASEDPAKPRHLDPSALDTPGLAIACAAREAMRIGDFIEHMLAGLLTVLKTNDRTLAQRLRSMDDVVDQLYTAVKLYLTQIPREALEQREGRRWADIVSFAINMEQVGDIIERILTDLEDKKIDKGRNFSEAGMTEIVDLHGRLIANLRLGLSVFLNADLKHAQQLLAQKVLFRDLERAYANSHLGRLAGNTVESIETSSMHLDLISDLRRINSHICSIAYPILEEAGVLAHTRLKTPEPVAADPAAAAAEGATWQKRKPKTA
jgi:phosphate:Na+ symporter